MNAVNKINMMVLIQRQNKVTSCGANPQAHNVTEIKPASTKPDMYSGENKLKIAGIDFITAFGTILLLHRKITKPLVIIGGLMSAAYAAIHHHVSAHTPGRFILQKYYDFKGADKSKN